MATSTPERVNDAVLALIEDAASDAGVSARDLTLKALRLYAEPLLTDGKFRDVQKRVGALKAGEFNQLRDSVANMDVDANDVEKQNFSTISRQNRTDNRTKARLLAEKADFMVAMDRLMDDHKGFKVPGYKPPPKKGSTSRAVNLHLSDLHYGADLKLDQNLVQFNWVEEARRTASICAQTAAYKRDHRAQSILHVYLNGDVIQGMLGHDPRDGHPITKQFFGAVHVLSQALRYLGGEYPLVKVFCQPGNHGRMKERHFSRATVDKWDSYETMLYCALQQRFSDVENIRFFQEHKPWGEFEVLGRHGMFTHGDTVVNVGNPGKSLNMHAIEAFIERTNAARAAEGLPVFELVTIGHTHIPVCTMLDSGCWFINNGSLIPSDGFAASIGRIHKKHNTQALWESTEEHIVGDYRLLKVGRYTDKDASLDRLIQPYDGGLVLPKTYARAA